MKEVKITERPLVIAVLVAFGLWVLVQIIQQALWVFVVILVAIILAAAMMPVVRFVRRRELPPRGWRVPKALIVIAIYLLAAAVAASVAFLVGAILLEEIAGLAEQLPAVIEEITGVLDGIAQTLGVPGLVPSPEQAAEQAERLVAGATELVVGLLEGLAALIFQAFMVLILALFLVAESERIVNFWVHLFPPKQRDTTHRVTTEMGNKVGYWVLGQILVAINVGVLAGIAMAVLGMPYPAVIGVVTGLLDLMPAVGPSLMVVPVFLLGLTQSPFMAIAAAAIFLALAELDAHVITPLITGRVVRLSRVVILAAVLLGLALYGAAGALVAIPVAASLQVLVRLVLLPWLRERQGLPSEEVPEEGEEGEDGEQ